MKERMSAADSHLKTFLLPEAMRTRSADRLRAVALKTVVAFVSLRVVARYCVCPTKRTAQINVWL